MAEYELPPLRIKILGDGRGWKKAIATAVSDAKEGARDISKAQSSTVTSLSSVQRQMERETKRHWGRMAQIAKEGQKNYGRLTSFGSAVVKSARVSRQGSASPFSRLIKDAERGAKQASRAAVKAEAAAQREIAKGLKTQASLDSAIHQAAFAASKQVEAAQKRQVNAARKNEAALQRDLLNGLRKRESLDSAINEAAFAASKRVESEQRRVLARARTQQANEARESRRVHNERIRRLRQLDAASRQQVDRETREARASEREARRAYTERVRRMRQLDAATRRQVAQEDREATRQHALRVRRAGQLLQMGARASGPTGTRSTGSRAPVSRDTRSSGMGFLGDRADIYMHTNAIKSIASAWSSPLAALTEYQTKVAAMSPLLGGKAQATAFVGKQEQTTVGQVYGAQALVGASDFLGAGMGLAETEEMLKRVGDLALGNKERFRGLALAFSQVAATGHLQGDELRQLSEQNFPLLQLMAKHTGKSIAELRELMEKRGISAKAVMAVVKAETAVGGKYAGMLNEMANTLGGATLRVESLYTTLRRKVMETVSAELVQYVQKLGSLLVMINNWVTANPEIVKQHVMLALKVTAAVVAFHALGFAVALVSWQLHALRRIMAVLAMITSIYNGAIRLLVASYTGLRIASGMLLASMVMSRTAMAGLIATGAAWAMALRGLTVVTFGYAMSIRVVSGTLMFFRLVMFSMAGVMARSIILTRLATTANLMFATVLRALRVVVTSLRLGFILTWLAFLGPVAAVVAAVLAIAGAIGMLVQSVRGEGGFMGAITRTWEAVKAFAVNTIGFFMNIGHNSQIVAKYIYDNFGAMLRDVGRLVARLFVNWVADTVRGYHTMARLAVAFAGWLFQEAPGWGKAIANGMWEGFVTLFTKLKDGFTWIWTYAKTGKPAEGFSEILKGFGEDFQAGREKGFLGAAQDIIADHMKNSSLLNNWDNLGLESPAIQGLKFDWKEFDILENLPDLPPQDEIPGQTDEDIKSMLGPGEDKKTKDKGRRFTVPEAIRHGSGEFRDRIDALRMGGVADASPDERVADNTEKTNLLLTAIMNKLPGQGEAVLT